MPCLVRLYDRNFVDLCNNSIEIAAIDQGPPPVNCGQVQTSQPVGPRGASHGCGAVLLFPQTLFVYQVAIHDRAGGFAGTTIPDLNGNRPGDLDVVLHAAPPPGSNQGHIRAPAPSSQVSSFVEEQSAWTREHKLGVKSVARALVSLIDLVLSSEELDRVVEHFFVGYAEFLVARGIDLNIFRMAYRTDRF